MKKLFPKPETLTFFVAEHDVSTFNKEKFFEDVDKWITSVSPDIWADPTLEIEVEIIDGEIGDE